MSDMDDRIERAAKALNATGEFWDQDWSTPRIVEFVINAAFPELFDGTAWVAPMQTPSPDHKWVWNFCRDAHLKGQETDSKVEG